MDDGELGIVDSTELVEHFLCSAAMMLYRVHMIICFGSRARWSGSTEKSLVFKPVRNNFSGLTCEQSKYFIVPETLCNYRGYLFLVLLNSP